MLGLPPRVPESPGSPVASPRGKCGCLDMGSGDFKASPGSRWPFRWATPGLELFTPAGVADPPASTCLANGLRHFWNLLPPRSASRSVDRTGIRPFVSLS